LIVFTSFKKDKKTMREKWEYVMLVGTYHRPNNIIRSVVHIHKRYSPEWLHAWF
jgi:hypothetical protein